MSSKRVGINHKEYGVTSRGLVKFAEVAMKNLGLDMHRDTFRVKITGGTNGDVAGNALRLLIERCPKVRITGIAAGAGALFDPSGADPKALERLLLKRDVVDFDPQALHPGGFIIFRHDRRKEGLKEMHRKLVRTETGLEESWITADEFHREFEGLIFSVPADLFLPCGGRPETIDASNWPSFFAKDGTPSARVIAEGANSYITPEAREALQKKGVVVIRDASANKCGVISSSYEIIGNLLMTEKAFLDQKEAYVRDVLRILDKRAEEEAALIFQRHRDLGGKCLYTEISNEISTEINTHYEELFDYFQSHADLVDQPLFVKVLLNHLPAMIGETRRYRMRVKNLPHKIKCAILSSEIATSIVYRGGWEPDFDRRLMEYVKDRFSALPPDNESHGMPAVRVRMVRGQT
jgi:glutamate dehydrogenase